MTLRTTLQAASLLAREFVVKPAWAIEHVIGFWDYRTTNSHRKLVNERHLEEWAPALDRLVPSVGRTQSVTTDQLSPVTAGESSIPSNFAGSVELCAILRGVVQRLRPETVMEIGVGRGTTTTSILVALAMNERGTLHSIEFPSLRYGYRESVGTSIPSDLKRNWTLHWGPSSAILPALLTNGLRAEVVIHDAAHSYRAQRADFKAISAWSRIGDVLIVDDVTNDAFFEVIVEPAWSVALVRQSKADPIGLAIRVR